MDYAFIRCLLLAMLFVLAPVVAVSLGQQAEANKELGTESESTTEDSANLLLVEVTDKLGLRISDTRWPDGYYLTPEITPGGLGLIDYDQDGDLDIYQVAHGVPSPRSKTFSSQAANRLFRQEADGQFAEVPGAAGLADKGYGHGCAMGDYDNDGDVDVLVTNYGPNTLYRNDGGKFVEVTEGSGIAGDHWSSAAAFFDYDRDGDLDLMIVNFGVFDLEKRCSAAGDTSQQDYCGPHLFDGVTDQLYRNNGDGTFTDVSEAAGITTPARGWGLLCVDLTGDGLPDMYVCNDEEPNQLWVNGGDGTFFDEAMFRGSALNGYGRVEASMGVAVGDVDGNGLLDLFMTHVASESNTLYTLSEDEMFADATPQAGMANVDLPYTGWGCGLVDLDQDGDLDLPIANGRVAKGSVRQSAKLGKYWNRYAEGCLLFLNNGRGQFENASDRTGSFHASPQLTRGMAFGDLDNDGDLDIVTNSIDNRLRVFQNQAPADSSHWIQLRLRTGKRDAIGAMVTLKSESKSQKRVMLRSYSYLASNDPRVHFGLGESEAKVTLVVRWPDGKQESFGPLDVDQVVSLAQGEGSRK